MATYVPGSETYLPDIKPFTPDYKFLSSVLDVRQDKYNSNWQATNDIYNKVVYADMSREDTTQQREQYINNLAPALEKIAGMDLSLAQNAQSAKAVFAPFFENKVIVKDMVKTANYKKQMAHAERLLSSPDSKINSKYWRDGVAFLQYRMEDFINMTPEEALAAPMYKYAPQVNLFELSNEILGGLEPPLKMEVDVAAYNPDGTVNPDWIITQTNGDLVTGTALEILRRQLSKNPQVLRAYQTQAYVAGRDFAAAGIEEGKYGSVQEGQEVWLNETLGRIESNNKVRLTEGAVKLADLKNINVRWNNYKQTNGIIPGSDDEKLMNEKLSAYEATKLAMEGNMEVRNMLSKPSLDFESKLNSAYQLLMMTNLDNDIIKEAESFSMRDFKAVRRETDASKDRRKFKYDMQKILYRAQLEGFVDDPNAQTVQEPANFELRNNTSDLVRDENGEVTDKVHIMDFSNDQFRDAALLLKDKKVNQILATFLEENPNGELVDGVASHKWTINIDGEDQSLSYADLRTVLSQKDKNGNFVHDDSIEAIWQMGSDLITTLDANGDFTYRGNNPEKVNGESFRELYAAMVDVKRDEISVYSTQQTTLDIFADSYELAKVNARNLDHGLATLMDEGGMPDILSPEGLAYSKQEYIDHVMTLVKEGKVTNVDQWGWDSGTGNSDYMTQVYHRSYAPYGGSQSLPVSNPDGTPKMKLDENAVIAEAGQVYDALYNDLNQGLSGTIPGRPTATFNSVALGLDYVAADLGLNASMVEYYDPKDGDNSQGAVLFDQYTDQIKSLKQLGVPITYLSSSEIKDSDNWSTEASDPMAEAIMEDFEFDAYSYDINDKSPNNIKDAPRAEFGYSRVLGVSDDGEIFTAGWEIFPQESWLSSGVKGGVGKANYAGLDKVNIEKYSKGITVLFPQDYDINPRKNNTLMPNAIVSEIMASETQSITYPQFADSISTGGYTIQRLDKLSYNLTYNERVYQIGGTYVNAEPISYKININPHEGFTTLDNYKKGADQYFKTFGLEQSLARTKDQKLNGKK